MHVLLESNHEALDNARFFEAVSHASPIPPQFSLLACFRRMNPLRVTCVWESESADQVKQFVDPLLGGAAKSSYYPIEAVIPLPAETSREGLENPYHLHEMGKRLARSNPQAAMALFELNSAQNPHIWFVPAGLARGHAALGDFQAAVEHMKMALDRAPLYRKEYVKRQLARLESRDALID